MASTPHVWLITGCSAGFGISIARAVLAHGHLVVATSRNPAKTPDLVEEITQKGGHWLTLDVTSPEEDIKKVVEKARDLYGHIDVVVNNAGFAVVSALEDVDEALALELSPFGIRVLLVEPGAFRTNFLGQNAVSYQPPSDPYLGTAVEKTQQYLHSENGKQPGDPEKAAERIYEVVMGEGMAKDKKQYLRLVLGNKAYENARLKVADLSENFLALEDISRSTDY
ncbi:NAD(P)-binding protein [Aspergillus brunneoviolaceus CBS 621.78]|uniref:NAD(P)-binding protein n=1 Tax=Aspergillus brunneoviolaceus CBS 621.78 TaxID=1450534 RepID=A0ACD1GI67_9EURO|nr:NAD(P)-binding protein [Aspergillus brunneoviolaceus CBS 621.78]RAH48781.1 NAD(P)-binding protein [Aspergillus brunneoviolaceus CBS 621.78]